MTLRLRICGGGGPLVRGDEFCPNVDRHQPHPSGYVAHADWAHDALIVADQKRCEGCGRWEIWVPKSPEVRIAKDWPVPPCRWGRCRSNGRAERFDPQSREWLPACRRHTGVSR